MELCSPFYDEGAETINLVLLGEHGTACPGRTSAGLQVGRELAFLSRSESLAWLRLMDYYSMPHVMQFGTATELIHLLQETDLVGVSRRMAEFSETQRELIAGFVDDLLGKIAMLHPDPASVREMPGDYDRAMRDLYPDLQIG